MKLDSVQVLRAIAANVVVLSHLRGIEQKYGNGIVFLPEWVGIAGPAGVHLFFVISGCVIVMASRGITASQFMVARVTRIYPLYWFYTSLMLIAIALMPSTSSGIAISAPTILKSFALWPDVHVPILALGWSLIFEMYFYVVWGLLLFLRAPLPPFLVLWALFIVAYWLFGPEASSPELIHATSPLVLEFLTGALVGMLVHVLGSFHARSLWLLTMTGVVVAFFFYCDRPPHDQSMATALSFSVAFGLLLGLSIGAEKRYPDFSRRSFRWLVMLGDASYSIYLSHALVLSVLGRLNPLVHSGGLVGEVLFVITCFVAANVAGLVSYLLIERPIAKVFRQWRRQPAC